MKKSNKKKGQMMGQIFVFILALVVFSGVLLYGYQAIFSIKEGVEDAAFITFYEELNSKVEQVGIDYGSVKKFKSLPPQGFKELCFIDLNKVETDNTALTDLRSSHPIVADAVEGGTDQNLFFTPFAKTPTKLSKLEIDAGFLCLPIENRELILRLEGLGDRTKVSVWN